MEVITCHFESDGPHPLPIPERQDSTTRNDSLVLQTRPDGAAATTSPSPQRPDPMAAGPEKESQRVSTDVAAGKSGYEAPVSLPSPIDEVSDVSSSLTSITSIQDTADSSPILSDDNGKEKETRGDSHKPKVAGAHQHPTNCSTGRGAQTSLGGCNDGTAEGYADSQGENASTKRTDIIDRDDDHSDERPAKRVRTSSPSKHNSVTSDVEHSNAISDSDSQSDSTNGVDHDETSDNDPGKRRALRKTRARPLSRQLPHSQEDDGRDGERPEHKSQSEETTPERPLIACFKFSSVKGKAAYSELLSQLAAQSQVTEPAGYNLRGRNKSASRQITAPDGLQFLALDQDERARPFARGCKSCSISGQRCSLLDHEKEWPCLSCYEAKQECELHEQPIRKRACENCKRRRRPCSYTNTRNHGDSCQQCDDIDQPCVAGPAKDFIRRRIRYPAEGEPNPKPKSKKASKKGAQDDCVECIQTGRTCRYPTEYDGGACEHCRRNCLPCTISDTSVASILNRGPVREPGDQTTWTESTAANTASATRGRKETTPLKQEHAQNEPRKTIGMKQPRQNPILPTTETPSTSQAELKHNQTPDPNLLSQAQPFMNPPQASRIKGTVKKIQTSFRHPIDFNCDHPEDTTTTTTKTPRPCTFCADPPLAILGFGRVKVQVMDWKDGRGYTEIRGGHQQVENTRVCIACTTARLAILACDGHEMRRFSTTTGAFFFSREENEAAADALMDGRVRDLGAFCALCSNLASYRCGAADGEGEGEDDCGLKLCAVCNDSLGREYRGRLQVMLAEADEEATEERPLGLRADCELLKHDGPLMRYVGYQNAMEQ
ncbi:hypothetical protein DOTSEDRAFT_30229 [Lecanosticta acicola]|uniref:Zn(2)-C6 fungal-type domain-containing protein n=1 Tax=Lecanosticta acicola TaxID=111012 RepID=A0AAI8YXP8_9PEZI|nr:hypothetical protein DOTSEDRAFT_30229 [Lecanosticta acicola]